MVEVFRTNVEDEIVAESLAQELKALLPGSSVNFDLEDCDRILRVAGTGVPPATVKGLLMGKGHMCEVLE